MAEVKTSPGRLALLAASAALLAMLATPAAALTINGYSTADNSRFVSGYPNAPVSNTSSSFLGAGYDWSGVGWLSANSNECFALLGPDTILIANHYKPVLPSTVQFFSTDGQLKAYTVVDEPGKHDYPWTNDLIVGTLASPIPASDNVNYYSILFQGYNANSYVNDNLLLYGSGDSVGWNQLAAAGKLLYGANGPYGSDSSNYLKYEYDPLTPNRAVVQRGDSGSPTFIATGVKGQMYLAGGHFLLYTDNYGNSSAGVDSFTSMSLPTLDSDMGQTGFLPYVVTPVTARWTGSGAGSWATGGNWSTGAVPADAMLSSVAVGTCASVLFDGAATSQRTITLGGSQTVTSITFASAAGANPFTITGSTTDLLTIGEAGIANLDNDAQTINCPIALRTSQRWAVGAGGLNVGGTINLASNLLLIEGTGNVTLSGAISGGTLGSLAIYGGGAVTLANSANSYGGKTFINGGALVISQDSQLGTAPGSPVSNQLTIDGGTLRISGTTTASLNANRGVALGSLGGTILVDSGGTLTANSAISGTAAALTVAGPGSVVLTASNSYSGPTTVNDATLALTGSAGGIAQSSGYTVSEGTLRLDNSNGNDALAGNRTNAAAALTLQGGTLQIVAAGTGTTTALGNLAAAVGENTYALSNAGTGALIVANGMLGRTAGATLNFTGIGANSLSFSGLSGFIDQGTFVSERRFRRLRYVVRNHSSDELRQRPEYRDAQYGRGRRSRQADRQRHVGEQPRALDR